MGANSSPDIFYFLFSFLGGGTVATLIGLWFNSRIEFKRRRIDFIRTQLQELYGPLQFFASSNRELINLVKKHQHAIKAEYADVEWSSDYNTQQSVEQLLVSSVEISNDYIQQIMLNNEYIFQVLTSKYYLIEPQNVAEFKQFLIDYTRNKTEINSQGLKIPLEIYNHIGPISFIRDEFIVAIEKQFYEKKNELDNFLSKRSFWQCLWK